MDYFDSAYFDGAYFDVDAVATTVGGGASKRSSRDIAQDWVLPPEPERESEDWLVLIL